MFSGANATNQHGAIVPNTYLPPADHSGVLTISSLGQFFHEAHLNPRHHLDIEFRSCWSADRHSSGRYVDHVAHALQQIGHTDYQIHGFTGYYEPVIDWSADHHGHVTSTSVHSPPMDTHVGPPHDAGGPHSSLYGDHLPTTDGSDLDDELEEDIDFDS